MKRKQIMGCLLGIAVGDAMGLPYEGLSPRRLRAWSKPTLSHSFLFGKGMVSDDTEHACMVAQSLIVAGDNSLKFQRALAWRLRWWVLALPAGVGLATLQACIRLWLGVSPDRSGVFSAGNGPAMRSPLLGVCYGGDRDFLHQLVKISTRLTHTDPKAEWGAMAIAIASYQAATQPEILPERYYNALEAALPPESREFLEIIEQACSSAQNNQASVDFAAQIGASRGVSGYIYKTVPIVIQIWLRYPENYREAILEIISLGGDTDSTATILGGIIGSRSGKAGIPPEWLNNLWEYPRSVAWMEKLAQRLAQVCQEKRPQTALRLGIHSILPRNILFLLVVLIHGLRRLLPPY
ncbi:MAG: ADP-ribosylglycohydrolase family protein [Jaaginema sp. PMC 1079.18]|nr:ADP-ribosylglycohydrolase family protein [Jaaginema sp. PMC 1080.18]MEC4849843.1 ADP-ribosylglycohydrolase family protein [Jaaginema sp. PMC 1079.18]MEC4864556.1 ADP-ribosylglycohydrolase family protein [Jaaginema sp. PMC 1078.18]